LGLAGDRCLWGSDWPHAFLEGRPMPDAGELLDLLHGWCSEEQLRKVMTTNPARLYGFDEGE
jgi:predicted TIM-barrel fold metal-dependent hydrolase